MSRMSRFLNFVLSAGKDRNLFGKMLLMVLLAGCGMEDCVRAETMVSSLQGTEIPSYSYPAGTWLASSFQTSTQTWTLSSITVQAAETNIALRLYSGDASNPSTNIAELRLSSIDPFGSRAVFSPTTPITLLPTNTYWVAVGNTSASDYLGLGVEDSNLLPFVIPGASMGFSLSGVISYGANPPDPWPSAEPGSALLFQVDGTPVPSVITRPTIQPLTLSGTNWLVQFQSQTGATYILQTAAGLNGTSLWTDVATNSGTGSLLSIPVPVAPGNAQQFFRLRVPVP